MRKTHFFIVNPAAGRKKQLSLIARIESFCSSKQIPFEITITKKTGHATEITSRIPNGSVIVAVGGDGTMHEVANGMIGTDSILGLLPMGTSNDFSWQCGYGSNLEKNLQILNEAHVERIDVGRLNRERYIINAMSVGFDALVTKRAATLAPYVGGFLSYVLTATAQLPFYSYASMHVEIDGRKREEETLFLVCANGKRYGGGFMIAPHANLNDGLLDIVTVRKASWLYLLSKMPKLVRGTHEKLPEVTIEHAQSLKLNVSRSIEAQIDGEVIKPHATFNIQMVQKALHIITNPARERI